MSKALLVCILIISSGSTLVHAQDKTVIFLVRHAEKEDDGTEDPSLSREGKLRANRLAYVLNSQPIEVIYSTKYSRNLSTIYPVANYKGIITKVYKAHQEDILEEILSTYSGKSVLICGHSNTIPQMVNKLVGEDRYSNMDEDDYDDLFIVTLSEIGKGTVIHLNY